MKKETNYITNLTDMYETKGFKPKIVRKVKLDDKNRFVYNVTCQMDAKGLSAENSRYNINNKTDLI